jgi:general secretion pathway protein A
MYLNHFELDRPPFQLAADPAFLWAGKKHRAALDLLKQGILENRGFVVMTGEVGTGKTTLVNAFTNLNEIATVTVTIPDPDMEPLDFFNYLSSEFGLGRKFDCLDEFERFFRSFLLQAYATYKKVLVIIDEAQRLNAALLEAVHHLAGLEMSGRRLLKIFFVGQPEFAAVLAEERHAAVRREVVAAHHLEPLDARETAEYIIHRLAVAGCRRPPFTPRAILRIHAFAGGSPRTVNVLCDQCLLKGFAAGIRRIDADIVAECAAALQLRPMESGPAKHALPFPATPPAEAPPGRGTPEKTVRLRRRAAVLLAAAAAAGGVAYYFGLCSALWSWLRALAGRAG